MGQAGNGKDPLPCREGALTEPQSKGWSSLQPVAASTHSVPQLRALLGLRVPGKLPPQRKSLTARLLLKTNISEAGGTLLSLFPFL